MRILLPLLFLLGLVGCTKKALMCENVDALEVSSLPPMGGRMEIENDLPPDFSGKVKTCYQSGRVYEIANFKDRIQHGEEIAYHDTEKRVLRSKIQYKNGHVVEGKAYCLDGNVDWKFTTDKNGVGKSISYHSRNWEWVEEDEDGNPIIYQVSSFYKGVQHGVFKRYFATEDKPYGLQVQGEYKNGFRDGWWYYYDRNERILFQDNKIVLREKVD